MSGSAVGSHDRGKCTGSDSGSDSGCGGLMELSFFSLKLCYIIIFVR